MDQRIRMMERQRVKDTAERRARGAEADAKMQGGLREHG